jgi:hypothetical protein
MDAVTTRIYPPWNDAQVDALNYYQASGAFHPFTCPDHPGDGEVLLLAVTAGWRCIRASCGYTQSWAHAFMADREAVKAAVDQLREDGFKVDEED